MVTNRSMVKPMESSANSNVIVSLTSSASPSCSSRLAAMQADPVKYLEENKHRLSDETVKELHEVNKKLRTVNEKIREEPMKDLDNY
jgi:hypothetical protein